MVYLSKSKYCGLWQCPKIAWLRQYKPEAATIDEMVQARFDAGNVVGDLAMGLFGDFVEVTTYNGEKLDLPKMIEKTAIEMEKGTENICEASFSYNGLFISNVTAAICSEYVLCSLRSRSTVVPLSYTNISPSQVTLTCVFGSNCNQ